MGLRALGVPMGSWALGVAVLRVCLRLRARLRGARGVGWIDRFSALLVLLPLVCRVLLALVVSARLRPRMAGQRLQASI